MSLEQLCVEIEDRSNEQAAAQVKGAEEAAKRLIEEAKVAAQRTLEAARVEAQEFSTAEAAERMTAARLEVSRTMGEARDEAVRQSLAGVWEYYRAMPKRAGYAAKLRQWAGKATAELDMPGATLRASASDLSILRAGGFKVNPNPIDASGGVRAESRDGRIVVDYTLEAQFERKREDLLHQIHQQLFSAEEESSALENWGSESASSASAKRVEKKKKKSRR